MALERIDHIGITVADMASATEFFVELGLELLGDWEVSGEKVDRIIGLEGARSAVAMLEVPGTGARIELSEFKSPAAREGDPGALVNTLGIRHLCFAVDDLEGTLERLRPHGAELIGEVVNYEDMYLLCYLRGPDGIIVELAEKLGAKSAA